MATTKKKEPRYSQWQAARPSVKPQEKLGVPSDEVPTKIHVPEWTSGTDKKPIPQNRYSSVTSAEKRRRRQETRARASAQLAPGAHAQRRHSLPFLLDARSASRRPRPAPRPVPSAPAAVKPPTVTPPEKVVIAFEGWVEQVADGVATLRLVDAQGRRSVATYEVADLERDSIPAEVGTAFRCQVVRNRSGFHISFQPVPRRTLSEVRRKQREARTIAAYSSLQNDY